MTKITDTFYAVKLKDGTLHAGVGRSQRGPLFLLKRNAESFKQRDLKHIQKQIEYWNRQSELTDSPSIKKSRADFAMDVWKEYVALSEAEIVPVKLTVEEANGGS